MLIKSRHVLGPRKGIQFDKAVHEGAYPVCLSFKTIILY